MQMLRCCQFVQQADPALSVRERKRDEEGQCWGQGFHHSSGLNQQKQQQAQGPQQQQQQQSSAPQQGHQSQLEAEAAHGIKRGLRVEDLKPPPVKRAKNQPQKGAAGSPSASSPGLEDGDSPLASAATPPGAKGGKRASISAAPKHKAGGKKGRTPAEVSKDARADIMAAVKAEHAKAEQQKGEAGSPNQNAGPLPLSSVQPPSPPLVDEILKAEENAEAIRRRDEQLAAQDPAALVEATWNDLMNSGLLNVSGLDASSPSSRALDSLLSNVAQHSQGGFSGGFSMPVSMGLPSMPMMSMPMGAPFSAPAPTSLPELGQQSSSDLTSAAPLELDIFDFIDASATGPDVLSDRNSLEASILGSTPAEPPAETPELVTSSRLANGSASTSGTPAAIKDQNKRFSSGSNFTSNPNSNSPSGEVDSDSPDAQPTPADGSNLPSNEKATTLLNEIDNWFKMDHFANDPQAEESVWALVP